MPRSREITKSGPCERCDDTESTIPSNGNTASSPLHFAPTYADSDVTSTVSAAPASIRPKRSERASGAPAATPTLRGRNDCPNSTAASATPSAQTGDTGSSDNTQAHTNHVTRPAAHVPGHDRERQVPA